MYRSIDCATWDDPWFEDLEPLSKLVFLYFVTNRRQTACGAFGITLRSIVNETRIPQRSILKILEQLEPKIKWWPDLQVIAVRNFYKHQNAHSGPKFIEAARKSLYVFPTEVQVWLWDVYPELNDTHPRATPVPPPTHGVTETVNSNSNSTVAETENAPAGARSPSDNRLQFQKEFRDAYPVDTEGRKPAPSVIGKALAKVPLQDREIMLVAVRNYAQTDAALSGKVYNVRRFVNDEWEKYLTEAQPRKVNGNGTDRPNPKFESWRKLRESVEQDFRDLAAQGVETDYLKLLPGGEQTGGD